MTEDQVALIAQLIQLNENLSDITIMLFLIMCLIGVGNFVHAVK